MFSRALVLLLLAIAQSACSSDATSPSSLPASTDSGPSAEAGDGNTTSGVILAVPDVITPLCQGDAAIEGATPSAGDATADDACRGIDAATMSFASDVAPLVGCGGENCHAPWRYATLVGVASRACCDHRNLVEPGRPSQSHLVQAIVGVDACVQRMPPGHPLADTDIAKIVTWICQGASDN